MSALRDIPPIPEDEHPAMLLARAHELTREADELAEQARAKRAEAGRLQGKAERLKDGAHLAPVKKKIEPPDPLLAAAALATEDLEGYWQLEALGELLDVRSPKRLTHIVNGLIEMNLVVKVEDKYRTVDPEESRVRDELRVMGTGSQVELAHRLDMPRATLDYYLELGASRGWASIGADGHLMYLRPGPERIITTRPRRRPPENDPPAFVDAPRRGEAIRVVNHGERGRKMMQPKAKHQIKQRDERRKRMETAKAERATAAAAKATQVDPALAARRAKAAAKRRAKRANQP